MLTSFGVYQITVNDKIYIGSTVRDFKRRWNEHLGELRKGTHENLILLNHYNKYGEEALDFLVLHVCEKQEDVIMYEQQYINELKPLLNIRKIAENNLGLKYPPKSDECKKKLSEMKKGKPLGMPSTLHRQHLSEANKGKGLGRHLSEETKQKISLGNLGKTISEETREKQKNRVISDETIAKIANSNRGKKRTEEQRKKISDGLIGIKWSDEARESHKGFKHSEESIRKMENRVTSEETRQKLSDAHKGNKLSDNTKQKIKESWVRRKQNADKFIVA